MGLRVSAGEITQLAEAAGTKILADDVPSVIGAIRAASQVDYQLVKVGATVNWPAVVWDVYRMQEVSLRSLTDADGVKAVISQRPGMLWGTLGKVTEEIRMAGRVARETGARLLDILPTGVRMQVEQFLEVLGRTGLGRQQALDWGMGTYEVQGLADLHPECYIMVNRAAAMVVATLLRGKRLNKVLWCQVSHTLGAGLRVALKISTLYRRCYEW
jgi:hypothetical protein